VPSQFVHPRREGTVTVRTGGPSVGGIYIYRADCPERPGAQRGRARSSMGSSLQNSQKRATSSARKSSRPGSIFSAFHFPRQRRRHRHGGSPLRSILTARTALLSDRTRGTTLEVLAGRAAKVKTAPVANVIDIELDDAHSPQSCETFRRITGLAEHDTGMMPAFFVFDDVFLFKPKVPTTVKIYPENCPADEVPAAALAITNDSRKGSGLVGVRLSANREFGPTSEPFEGTNIIGRVIDTEKLKSVKERQTVYIREVRK